VREVCVVVLEQMLQLYPDERQSKKNTNGDWGAIKQYSDSTSLAQRS